MHLPELNPTPQKILMTNVFLGYNANDAIQDGEMADMLNLSGRSYPLLDQRERRAILDPAGKRTTGTTAPANPAEGDIWTDTSGTAPVMKIRDGSEWVTISRLMSGILGRDKLVTIEGTKVLYNRVPVVGIEVSAEANKVPKKIVSMGAYVCIWPDKVYFNAANTADCGSMERKYTEDGEEISLTMCRANGVDYDYTAITSSTTAPANPSAGDLWMDTSGSMHKLKQYSSAGEWVEVATTYIKISATGIGTGLSVYDTVTISGMSYAGHDTVSDQVSALNTDNIVYDAGNDYVIVAGILSQAVAALDEGDVTVNREVPDLDYICESNNRLWGCSYGIKNGTFLNEIRASKLGDFRNWSSYMGMSTDSYTVSVGTDGPFTGAASQRGYPVFFKDNCVHRVTGSGPSSFSTSVIGCRGIQDGSWRSIAMIDENIFYKSRDGIYYFDGSMAYRISDALGDNLYSDARAGELSGKYYISMKNANGEWSLFVYDTREKMWHREDRLKALGFATVNGELYAIDEDADVLVMMTGRNPEGWSVQAEEDFEWRAVFGLFGTDYTNQKYLSRFNLRMQMDEDATVHLAIQYDQNGEWHDQGEIRGRSTRTFMQPVVPRRCDHLQVRLSGKGRCRVYSISRVLEVGGDG